MQSGLHLLVILYTLFEIVRTAMTLKRYGFWLNSKMDLTERIVRDSHLFTLNPNRYLYLNVFVLIPMTELTRKVW